MKQEQKTKSSFIALPLIIFSIVAVLGCRNMFEPPTNVNLSAGMGTFTLRIADQDTPGRTIVPTPQENVAAYYRMIFTRVSDSVVVFDEIRELNDLTVVLNAGTYNLTVYAFTNTANRNSNRPSARGTADAPIEINDGDSITGFVELRALGLSTGTGTFSWNVGWGDLSLASANMEITPLSGGAATSLNLLGGTSPNHRIGSQELPSGFYRVVFTLERDADTRPVTWRETLHVYENMVSHFSHTFSEEHFITRSFIVTFNFNFNGAPPSLEESHFINSTNFAPPDPTRANYNFAGWFTNNADFSQANKWDFATPLAGDLTLYAGWTVIPPADITSAAITVTAPEAGQVQDSDASGTGGDFTVGNVNWSPVVAVFIPGVPYTASVVLTAAENTVFSQTFTATINGQTAVLSDRSPDDRTITVSFEFPPAPVNWPSLTSVTASIPVASEQLVNFPLAARGWWGTQVSGTWGYGQMQISEYNDPIPVNLGGITGVSPTSIPIPTDVTRAIGGLGSFRAERFGVNNPTTMRFTLTLYGDFDTARLQIFRISGAARTYIDATILPGQGYIRSMVPDQGGLTTDVHNQIILNYQSTPGNAEDIAIIIQVVSDDGWQHIEQGDVGFITGAPSYPVFISPFDGGHTYYWIDEVNQGRWSYGYTSFVTQGLTGNRISDNAVITSSGFNPPNLPQEGMGSSGTITVRTTFQDPYRIWFPDSSGLDFRGDGVGIWDTYDLHPITLPIHVHVAGTPIHVGNVTVNLLPGSITVNPAIGQITQANAKLDFDLFLQDFEGAVTIYTVTVTGQAPVPVVNDSATVTLTHPPVIRNLQIEFHFAD